MLCVVVDLHKAKVRTDLRSHKKIPNRARPRAMSAEPTMPPCSDRMVYCRQWGRREAGRVGGRPEIW